MSSALPGRGRSPGVQCVCPCVVSSSLRRASNAVSTALPTVCADLLPCPRRTVLLASTKGDHRTQTVLCVMVFKKRFHLPSCTIDDEGPNSIAHIMQQHNYPGLFRTFFLPWRCRTKGSQEVSVSSCVRSERHRYRCHTRFVDFVKWHSLGSWCPQQFAPHCWLNRCAHGDCLSVACCVVP